MSLRTTATLVALLLCLPGCRSYGWSVALEGDLCSLDAAAPAEIKAGAYESFEKGMLVSQAQLVKARAAGHLHPLENATIEAFVRLPDPEAWKGVKRDLVPLEPGSVKLDTTTGRFRIEASGSSSSYAATPYAVVLRVRAPGHGAIERDDVGHGGTLSHPAFDGAYLVVLRKEAAK